MASNPPPAVSPCAPSQYVPAPEDTPGNPSSPEKKDEPVEKEKAKAPAGKDAKKDAAPEQETRRVESSPKPASPAPSPQKPTTPAKPSEEKPPSRPAETKEPPTAASKAPEPNPAKEGNVQHPPESKPSTPEKPPAAASKDSPAKAAQKKLDVKTLIKKQLLAGAVRQEYDADDIRALLELAQPSMQKQCTLVEVYPPVNIVGDIHGQYCDLMRIFGGCGLPFQKSYLFLGDYVDRGRHSLEVIVLLLALQIKFPGKIVLLRGNHELPNINKSYGFWKELRERYPNDYADLYKGFNDVFAEMPLAALVANRILCMHGGIGPDLKSLDDIRKIQRPITKATGLAQDLLWADPEPGVNGFAPNKIRNVSHVFGEDMVRETCKKLGIDMIIRAHQVVEFGYAFFCRKKLITVFSAARYHEDMCNYAAVVQVDEHLELSFVQLKPHEYDKHKREHVPTQEVDEDEE